MMMKQNLQKILSLGVMVWCVTLVFAIGAEDGGETAKKVTEEGLDWFAFLGPFHTVTLHLPIGMLAFIVVLEMYAWFNPAKDVRKVVSLALWFGALTAITAAALGYALGEGGGYEGNAVWWHRWTGIGVGVVTFILAVLHSFAFRRGELRRIGVRKVYLVLLVANMGLLAYSGHLGGNLTHGSEYLWADAPEWIQDVVHKIEGKGGKADPDAEKGEGVYAEVIQPIFEEKCYQCHGEEKQKGDYRMDTIKGLFTAGESELEPIVAGRVMESFLAETITLPVEDDLAMPPEGKTLLTPEETLSILRWIWNGAKTGEKKKTSAKDGADKEKEKTEEKEA
ncbi:MAG: hypothetical protein L3J39_19430 [Verrucomicrobiales bacterium]|nr:hypothetical protein [Verrucomicrobiales bacterium]